MYNLRALIIICACLAAPVVAAELQTTQDEQILRVGGDYSVESIDQVSDRSFKIVFKAETPSGRFDTLRLDADHVHVGVKVGQRLRLSAEILSQAGAQAEVAQMVIFFESQAGRVPVWLMSNKAPNRDLRATKYLEMHVPANDFVVM